MFRSIHSAEVAGDTTIRQYIFSNTIDISDECLFLFIEFIKSLKFLILAMLKMSAWH